MKTDPPNFAVTCALMLSGKNFHVDIDAIDKWIKSNKFQSETLAALNGKRAKAVAAFLQNDWDAVGDALTDWHSQVLLLLALPQAKEAVEKRKLRQTVNAVNSKYPRPGARTVDHDEIESAFNKLGKIGHTRREANGILFLRGLASRPTINRITKPLTNENFA